MSKYRTAVVTGANRGIGFEVCRQLAKKGFHVLLTARNEAAGLKARDKLMNEDLQVSFYKLDVSDERSIQQFARRLEEEEKTIRVLVNNAAINYDSDNRAADPDFNMAESAIRTNVFGPWRLTVALLPLMKAADQPRIVNVSSGSGAFAGMGGGTPAYSMSKAALNVLTVKLAAELTNSAIKVNSVCPGWVRTDMGGAAAPRSVEQGAEGIVWAATLPDDGPTGGFFRDGQPISW